MPRPTRKAHYVRYLPPERSPEGYFEPRLRAILAARAAAGLSQTDVASRIEELAPDVRLSQAEMSLLTRGRVLITQLMAEVLAQVLNDLLAAYPDEMREAGLRTRPYLWSELVAEIPHHAALGVTPHAPSAQPVEATA